jgi:hypothetical protein
MPDPAFIGDFAVSAESSDMRRRIDTIASQHALFRRQWMPRER